MRLTRALIVSTFAFTLATGIAPAAARAGDASWQTDAAAVRDFRLDGDFLARYMAVQDEAAKNVCELGMADILMHGDRFKSLDEAASHYDAQPGVHAMLARHGLTARQMILGMSTLVGAATQDMKETDPKFGRYVEGATQVSPQNMAVYRAHKDELRQHMRELGKRQLAANGGKPPSCLTD